MTKLIACLLICSIITGCAQTYIVRTTPTQADVKINGEYKGKSPVASETNCRTWGGRPKVEISKPGYKTTKETLSFEPSVGIIIVDVLLFWPLVFLNAECPKDDYNFMLEPAK